MIVDREISIDGAVMIKKADQITAKFVGEFSRKLLMKEGAAVAPAAAPAASTATSSATPSAPRTVVPVAPFTGDPYALTGLLGGSRRLWLDRGGLGTTSVPVRQLGSAGSRATGRRVVESPSPTRPSWAPR